MLKKLQFLTFTAIFALSCGLINSSLAQAVECSDGTTAEELSSCPESQANLCTDPNTQNACAPVERIVVSENSAVPSNEVVSSPVSEPPTEIIADTTTSVSDLSSSEPLWPMYLSLGALALAILLIVILNLRGRRQA